MFRAATEDTPADADDGEQALLHKFLIDFVTLRVRAIRNVQVQLRTVQETVITDTYLMYQTFPRESEDSEILYSLQTLPRHGALLLTPSGLGDHPQQARKLRAGAKFSQVDLLSGRLKYRLFRKVDTPIDDSFAFVVTTASTEQKSAEQTFRIHHVPGQDDVEITLERLEVEEGAKKAITKRYLEIRASKIGRFVFSVTRAPRHGVIDVVDGNTVVRHNSSFFTSDEIADEKVVYKHDDSESRRDTFNFMATSDSSSNRGGGGGYGQQQQPRDFEYVAVFDIHIVLRNDQTPTRVVDRVFQVSYCHFFTKYNFVV